VNLSHSDITGRSVEAHIVPARCLLVIMADRTYGGMHGIAGSCRWKVAKESVGTYPLLSAVRMKVRRRALGRGIHGDSPA
jgi:hypothetical protein